VPTSADYEGKREQCVLHISTADIDPGPVLSGDPKETTPSSNLTE